MADIFRNLRQCFNIHLNTDNQKTKKRRKTRTKETERNKQANKQTDTLPNKQVNKQTDKDTQTLDICHLQCRLFVWSDAMVVAIAWAEINKQATHTKHKHTHTH